jgi:hypothetical protein
VRLSPPLRLGKIGTAPRLALKLQLIEVQKEAHAMKTRLPVACCCVVLALASMAYTTKYSVKVTADPQTNFKKIKTYSWLPTHITPSEEAEQQIIAAIDRQLQWVGLTQVDAGSADVVVIYEAYSRTDVNTNAKEIVKDVRPTYPVGILVVSLLEPKTLRQVLELRTATPYNRPEVSGVINETVQAMFRRYPYRARG